MPAYIKPINADNWKDVTELTELAASPAWQDTLQKVQSGLVVAIKEYHYQQTAGTDRDFPDRYEPGHAFWPWFDTERAGRLYRMIDQLPDNFNRVIAEQIVSAARAGGVEFGAAG
ncbi:MAG: hypothetical protein KC897_06080 [Candidatus Omnitrophica bacterium]|nr:hypothetical protein [Candidatus Omnitrophota bacterium]MCB9719757.1 hypothetical protein [Candidatus Omnitrophota bacterium]